MSLASPIHAQRRASSLRPASAICRNDIVRLGQAVIVCVNIKSGKTENPPAVSIRYFKSDVCPPTVRSVATPPKRDGRLLERVMRASSRFCAPRSSLVTRTRNNLRAFVNLGRLLACWSFPLKPLQKSKSGLAKCFHVLSGSVVFHALNKAWRFQRDVQRNSVSGAEIEYRVS